MTSSPLVYQFLIPKVGSRVLKPVADADEAEAEPPPGLREGNGISFRISRKRGKSKKWDFSLTFAE